MPLAPNPDFPYCCDKAQVDRMFRDFASRHPGVCVTIGRTVAVTGPCGADDGVGAVTVTVAVGGAPCGAPVEHAEAVAAITATDTANSRSSICVVLSLWRPLLTNLTQPVRLPIPSPFGPVCILVRISLCRLRIRSVR